MKIRKKQLDTKDAGIQCIAHIHEGRIFNCPYSGKSQLDKTEFKCKDFEEIKEIGK